MFLTLGNIPEGISPKEYSRRNISVEIFQKEYLRRDLSNAYAMRERNQMKEEIMDDTEARMAFLELEMCFVSIYSCEVKMWP